MPSFDIVSEVNQVEVRNALDQANREISTRFDFKGSDARVEHKEKELTLKQMSRRTGLSISLLSQIERAESSPSISSLYKISVALDSRIQDLFGRD